MNDPTFSDVWANSGSGDSASMPDGNLVSRALADGISVSDDVADLIGAWPLCQLFRLKGDDVVVVAGAYQGKVMEALMELYPGIRMIGFEPQRWAVERATDRLLGRGYAAADPLHSGAFYTGADRQTATLWQILPFGLGDETRQNVPMGEFGTDACSFVNVGPQAREHGAGDLVDVVDAFNMIGHTVDLLVLNMEGYEFRLVRRLIETGMIDRIRKLAIQWHIDLAGNGDRQTSEDDVNSILGSVGYQQSHRIVYDERPTWTYSELRS